MDTPSIWAEARAELGFNPIWFLPGGALFGTIVGCIIGGIGMLLR